MQAFSFFLVRLPSLTVGHSPEMILLGQDGNLSEVLVLSSKMGTLLLTTQDC